MTPPKGCSQSLQNTSLSSIFTIPECLPDIPLSLKYLGHQLFVMKNRLFSSSVLLSYLTLHVLSSGCCLVRRLDLQKSVLFVCLPISRWGNPWIGIIRYYGRGKYKHICYSDVCVYVCVPVLCFISTKTSKNFRQNPWKNQQEKTHTLCLETINHYGFLGMILADFCKCVSLWFKSDNSVLSELIT